MVKRVDVGVGRSQVPAARAPTYTPRRAAGDRASDASRRSRNGFARRRSRTSRARSAASRTDRISRVEHGRHVHPRERLLPRLSKLSPAIEHVPVATDGVCRSTGRARSDRPGAIRPEARRPADGRASAPADPGITHCFEVALPERRAPGPWEQEGGRVGDDLDRASHSRRASASRPSANAIQPRISSGMLLNPGSLTCRGEVLEPRKGRRGRVAKPRPEDEQRVEDRYLICCVHVFGEEIGPGRHGSIGIGVEQHPTPAQGLQRVGPRAEVPDAPRELHNLFRKPSRRVRCHVEALDRRSVAKRREEACPTDHARARCARRSR